MAVGADLLAAAASLRWARPDLTEAIAAHVLEIALDGDDRDRWLAAAGWVVHARAATGDGREVAAEVLAALPRWGGMSALAGPAADRLRIELAMVAAGAGDTEVARGLVAEVTGGGDPELRADLLCVAARCAVDDAPDEVAGALRAAEKAWARVPGVAGEIGAASVDLIAAVVERRGRRPDAAADRAAAGLARLQHIKGSSTGSPSGHLAAALAAEWISALLDAGRVEEAREACGPLLARLSEARRPSRQLALLRLTVARAVALGESAVTAADLLERAAEDAAASDVPDLESVCRSALAALHEKAGRLDATLEALQRGVAAERRDRSRLQRFRGALAEVAPQALGASRASGSRSVEPRVTGREETTDRAGLPEWEELLRAPRGEDPPSAGGRRRREDRPEYLTDASAGGPNELGTPVGADRTTEPEDELSSGWGAVPWNGSTGESPIGDLLIRSMRAGGPGSSDSDAATPRNGTSPLDELLGERASGRRRAASAEGARDETAGEERGRGGRRRIRGGDSGEPEPDAADERHERGRPGGSRSAERSAIDELLGELANSAGGRTAAEPAEDAASERPERYGAAGTERRQGHRAADPWATGRWPVRSSGREQETEPATPHRSARSESDLDSDSWLSSALADLDRALSGLSVRGEEGADDPRCAVVIDVARDGRRFAGRRAAAVIRAVADRVADRLPAGARVRYEETDALSITRPGWTRHEATEWMHRTLTGLLEGLVLDEDFPGAQLRAAVHDSDGPVGAQVLHGLDGSWTSGAGEHTAGRTRRSSGRSARDLDEPAELGIGRRAPGDAAYDGDDMRGWPWAGDEPGDELDDLGGLRTRYSDERWSGSGPGRHEAGADYRAGGEDTREGHRHRRADPDPPLASEGRGRRHERRIRPDGPGDEPGGGADGPRTRRSGTNRERRDRPRDRDDDRWGASADDPPGRGEARRDRPNDPRASGRDRPAERLGERGDESGGTGREPSDRVRSSAGDRRRDRPRSATAVSTEGLGIADLLAGALAAYRGI